MSVAVQSIRSYFTADDDFNWNYGLALAATGKYREAEEALAAVQREAYRWVAAVEQLSRLQRLVSACIDVACFGWVELILLLVTRQL